MNAKRTITISITLDENDNETLEVMAGVVRKPPAEAFAEVFAEPFAKQVSSFFEDVRKNMQLNPLQKAALQSRGLAVEVLQERLGKR